MCVYSQVSMFIHLYGAILLTIFIYIHFIVDIFCFNQFLLLVNAQQCSKEDKYIFE